MTEEFSDAVLDDARAKLASAESALADQSPALQAAQAAAVAALDDPTAYMLADVEQRRQEAIHGRLADAVALARHGVEQAEASEPQREFPWTLDRQRRAVEIVAKEEAAIRVQAEKLTEKLRALAARELSIAGFAADARARFDIRPLQAAYTPPAPSGELLDARQKLAALQSDADAAREEVGHTGGRAVDDGIRRQARENLAALAGGIETARALVNTLESDYAEVNGVSCPA